MEAPRQGGNSLMRALFADHSAFLDEMERRARHVQRQLREQKNTALILGAGVSQSVKLPSWDRLLARATFLLTNIGNADPFYGPGCKDDPHNARLYNSLNQVFNGTDALEVAEYIDLVLSKYGSQRRGALLRLGSGDSDERLKALVRYCLYDRPVFSVAEHVGRDTTLWMTARLAARRFYVERGQQKNRSVITYNYDNLLEAVAGSPDFLAETGTPLEVLSLFDEADPPPLGTLRRLNVFHPHGFIDLCTPNRQESQSVVLSEKSFYGMEQKNYSWSNFLLARAIYDDVCLFIGFSGNDYNFRRIMKNLDDVRPDGEDPHRFLVVTIDELVFQVLRMYADISGQHAGDYDAPALAPRHLEGMDEHIRRRILSYLYQKEIYWKTKGVLPIWTTIADTPGLIEGLSAEEEL